MNDIIKVILTSLFSIAALFLLTKLIGRRQISQMSMFDYVNGITIGSIAAEMATDLELDVWLPLIAMVVYALVTVALTILSDKSISARKFIAGRAEILLHNDKLIRSAFKRTRIDINEFLTQCRTEGYFDISQLAVAIAEPNGRISFLPKAQYRPLSASDTDAKVSREDMVQNVILDGKIMPAALRESNVSEKWLLGELAAKGFKSPGEVFLATVDIDGVLRAY